ncbi:MAG: ATP--guanido phosphotransferase, partial [Clostridiales bacterium]
MNNLGDNKDKVFADPLGKWALAEGPQNDIVISTRLRLARNLEDIPFPKRLNPQQKREIAQKINQAIEKSAVLSGKYHYYEMAHLSSEKRRLLLEKHLISPQMAEGQPGCGVSIAADESVAMMINEEDHLRIQCFLPALQLKEAWSLADNLDNILAQELNWAYDK